MCLPQFGTNSPFSEISPSQPAAESTSFHTDMALIILSALRRQLENVLKQSFSPKLETQYAIYEPSVRLFMQCNLGVRSTKKRFFFSMLRQAETLSQAWP